MSEFENQFNNVFSPTAGPCEMINQGRVDYVNQLLEEAAQQDNKLLKSGKTVHQAIDEYINMGNM